MKRRSLIAATLATFVVATVTLTACGGETAPTEPTAGPQTTVASQPAGTPGAGWEKYEGSGAELWLPESYEGGDLTEDVDVIVESVRRLGSDYEQIAQMVEQNRSMYVIWAFDSEVGSSGVLTNANVAREKVLSAVTMDTYLDAVPNQLPDQWQVLEQDIVTLGDYQAGRLVIETPPLAASGDVVNELLYIVEDGNTMWLLTFATGANEWKERLPVFEKSALTFKTPGAANEPAPASSAAASPSASPEAATVGDAQSLETMDGGVVSVKLIATKRLPRVESYGIEMHPALFGVRLSLTNEGDSVYSDGVETCVTLIDAKGNAHEAVVPPISGKNANRIPGCLSLVKIAPGKRRSGWVYFKGGKALKPAQLQYTPDYGVGAQVGEWQLEM